MIKLIKSAVQKLLDKFNLKIIRINLQPWGNDLYVDLDRIKPLAEFKVVLDVGANVGQSTSVYVEKFKHAKIFSFEPFTESFEKLQLKSRINKNVACFQKALGNSSGQMKVQLQEKSTQNSLSTNRNKVNHAGAKTELIEVITLDEFVKTKGISQIDFIKIDTEGFETEVLMGGEDIIRSGKVNLISLEIGINDHERTTFYNEIHPYLTERGYDVLGFYKQSQSLYTKSRFLMHCDVLFINRNWSKTLRPSFVKSYKYD